ncbi:hypothetical protein [Butyrivibrio sp. LB2008]|uniref:hypothetical protein n=1 Tax=Butyrivibrio sp. LB2008 TaxID=1408305 RepID=UPI00047AA4A3|nr:hypothetical protein [Butyrivibrio sp. LB2008]
MKKRIALVFAYLFLIVGLADFFTVFTVKAVTEDEDFVIDRTHWDAGWKTTSIGPVSFDAPRIWYLEEGLYSPVLQDVNYCDCFIDIEYFKEDCVDELIAYDRRKYDDVYVVDEEVCGYPAKYVEYTYYNSGLQKEIKKLIYYIRMGQGGEVCMLLYDVPLEYFEEFVDDYYLVVNSVDIDDSKLKKGIMLAEIYE